MLMLRVLESGEIVWPYDRTRLEEDFPQPHNFPADLRLAGLSDFGVFEVADAPMPEPGPGQTVKEVEPAKVGEAWTRQFELVNPTSDDFVVHEKALYSRIDSEAGAFRTRFITDVPGQQQTYAEKEAEARAWTPEADPADFLFLSSEAAARGVPIADVVTLILATANAWRPLGAAIEGLRMGAKAAVTAARQANDWAAMDAAAAVDWEALIVP